MTRRRRRIDTNSQRGQTAVEFALIAPMLIVLVLGVLQIGIAFNHYLTVTDAARVAARAAASGRFSNITAAQVQQSARDAAADLNQTDLNVTVANPTWNVPQSDVTITVTYPYSIDLLGWVVASGNLKSTMTERVE
jgi:Flp pilus assembly protein TadG